MAGKSGRPKLILSPEQKEELARLSHSRGSPAREVQRAQILCRFEAVFPLGMSTATGTAGGAIGCSQGRASRGFETAPSVVVATAVRLTGRATAKCGSR